MIIIFTYFLSSLLSHVHYCMRGSCYCISALQKLEKLPVLFILLAKIHSGCLKHLLLIEFMHYSQCVTYLGLAIHRLKTQTCFLHVVVKEMFDSDVKLLFPLKNILEFENYLLINIWILGVLEDYTEAWIDIYTDGFKLDMNSDGCIITSLLVIMLNMLHITS